MLKKIDRRYVFIIAVTFIMIIPFISLGVRVSESKKKMSMEESKNVSSNAVVKSSIVNSILESQVSSDGSVNSTDTDSDSEDDVIKPIDCNPDFWATKLGIAECYDHIFKKGHMHGTTYYQGDCEEHEPTEINELARSVKLYRSDDYVYTAILPECEWPITLEDEKLKEIIDAQIEGSGKAYSADDVSIVMYFHDNALCIESANEE